MIHAEASELPRPSIDEVKKYLDIWENEKDNYEKMDKAIYHLIRQYPENKDINNVFLKCSVIDDIYHTRISQYHNIYDLSEHILKKCVDEKLNGSDATVVDDIAEYKNSFSFATKFCSFHKPDQYPIYDSHVDNALKYFNKTYGKFADKIAINPYMNFKEVMDNFIKYFDLDQGNYCYGKYKAIDIYLWLVGKNELNKLKKNSKQSHYEPSPAASHNPLGNH
ncbi:MAG: hypothetical protein LBB52_01255 [Desulfovibrio sp.]|jgi:hypothetical protein|nr:hypothetical protein [Desulfovibrio sp.]